MSPARPLVACLCAEWCGSCREYRPTFDALAKRFAEVADFAWIDIEDESDALGDPDIENFPTLLIAGDDRALFFGAVTPQAQTAERLVQGAPWRRRSRRPVRAAHPASPTRARPSGSLASRWSDTT